MRLIHPDAVQLLDGYAIMAQTTAREAPFRQALESGAFYRIPMRRRTEGFGKLRILIED